MKEETEDTQLRTSNHNNHEDANLWLVQFLYNTSREKMAELTDVPLDQVLPLSMITAFADEVKLLCNDMVDAQVEHFANWWSYHGDEMKKQGKTLEECCAEAMEGFGNPERTAKLLSIEWLYYYYQLRRSIRGDHKLGATTLAQDQIAAQQQQGIGSIEDLMGRLQEQ